MTPISFGCNANLKTVKFIDVEPINYVLERKFKKMTLLPKLFISQFDV